MTTTASNFYLRDIKMNLNPKEQIVNALNKLGYLNIDFDKKVKTYIDHRLSEMILNGKITYDKTFDFYIEQIKASEEFKKYYKHLEFQIKRSKEMNNFLSDEITKNNLRIFYESCTEDELLYLGY